MGLLEIIILLVFHHYFFILDLPGIVKELDKLAHQFVQGNVIDYPPKIKEAENIMKSFKDKTKLDSAKKYLNIMKKISSKGLNYIKEEIKRIQKMMREKLTEPQKKSFDIKLNILKSFEFAVSKKDEL